MKQMTETEDNLKSISWIRKNINVKLKTLNKIIKILNLNPTIRTNKFGEQTEYYDLDKIKELQNELIDILKKQLNLEVAFGIVDKNNPEFITK